MSARTRSVLAHTGSALIGVGLGFGIYAEHRDLSYLDPSLWPFWLLIVGGVALAVWNRRYYTPEI